MTYTVILSPEEGGYAVFCPALDVASQGDNREHALRMIVEAIGLQREWFMASKIDPEPETSELIARKIQQVLDWRAEEGLPPTIETATVDLTLASAAA